MQKENPRFHIEHYALPPYSREEYYGRALPSLARQFQHLSAIQLTPGISAWRLPQDGYGLAEPFVIAQTDSITCRLQGYSIIHPRRMYLPDIFSSVWTTQAFIHPDFRGKGILTELLTRGITVLTESRVEIAGSSPSLPVLLVENLIVPDFPEFTLTRRHLRQALSSAGYQSIAGTRLNTWYMLI